jgi:hypothetical protein
MLKLETSADFDRLIRDEIQESLTLDYKASVSLGRSNDQRKELVKDVSPSRIRQVVRSSTGLKKLTASPHVSTEA